ncbi:ABC transporter permease [Leuconostoc citreum]|uniref:ABC-type antimicrobial peptide transport system, permease component n=2 Tax=Leuconostoc citreum TaxID=33964 RepID=B1MW43_LEUCK|nr:ABC transporter permease [Leuconostoc citreum]ACA81848.1 ABC-type antimicrobial peptide transport system, permease component [Leuconostoc citreum KM20]MCJ2167853.1 ABC transporter permease [Leuconostoc citreum]MCS8583183.1 FtsX-like permease family protein [Leuconostoc citreum]MCS8600697.1 FtsX-like permease family protein [Leuconostoc citreum]MCT3055946.1 FtsX-like permease family protein [Leuconostoc citreum]
MQIRELFVSACRSLLSNKRRSVLTMVGIVIGIAAVITILALGDGARLAMMKNLQADTSGKQSTEIQFVSKNDSKVSGFSDDDLNRIRENDKVTKVNVQSDDHGILSATGNINGKNIDSTTYLAQSANQKFLTTGRGISKQDILVGNPVALVSQRIAKKGYETVKNALNAGIDINGTTYTIIGILSNDAVQGSYQNYDVVLPRQVFETNNNNGAANTLKLTFTTGTNVSKETQKIVDQLNSSGSQHNTGDYQFYDMAAMLKGISAVIKGITYFIVAVASISLFIAGIGVMNMMYIAVSERTQEIGIRMAVGASQNQILWQFLIEAVLLTLSGGMIGYLGGLGIAMGISVFLPFKASVSLATFILAFGTSTVVGLVFGILPAKTASNKNLIDILR